MEDYRLSQTGQEVQNILNGAAMDANLQAEVERATDVEGTLQGNIDSEERARQDADGLLQQGISDEENRAKRAEEANAGEIEGIKALIPSTASDANKLADTNYVNSSIQTATAEYRGDYNVVTDLHLAIDATHAQIETLLPTVIAEADKNDYCYVMIPTNASTPTEIAKIERYKMTSEGWKFEYDVNNSTFTAEEWAAIKSGITSGLVAKLNSLPTNADLMARLAGIEGDVDVVEGKVSTIESKIPSTASSENKLVDENHMNTSISTATATYRGDFNLVSDLHLAIDATHAQIATLLGSTIAEADNNDYCYVEIPTNAETPTQIAKVERYKFNGTAWAYEYVLNNSGFTAAQWAAINSMITSGLVAKLSALPTNADLLAMLAQKQDLLTFDSTPTQNSTNPVTSDGVFAADKALSDAIEAILLLIPSAATSLNKLVDTDTMNSSISTATATFRGTYNLISDLSLNIDATHEQVATMLFTTIQVADNNDYAFVQIPTSATTPTEIAQTDRYKYNGTAWAYEYTLNTSGFTSAQWAAINSGITSALVGDINTLKTLVPTEASALNQLADKAYVLAKILEATPAFKGQFTTLADLQAVASPKDGDLGIVRTKDSDGMDVFAFYQYLNNQWNLFYTMSYHPQTKPATTGTTGDYPYNGMGRVELSMNIVGGVNTLTQSMMPTATGGNTTYVIKYDFVLGGDITIPANCVLEFDGGSLDNSSGNSYKIDGNGAIIKADATEIFKSDVVEYNTFELINGTAYVDWFDTTDLGVAITNSLNFKGNKTVIKLSPKTYHLSSTATLVGGTHIDLNNSTIIVDEDVPAFAEVFYGADHSLSCANVFIHDGYIKINKSRSEGHYIIDIANASFLKLSNIYISQSNGITSSKYDGVRLGRKLSSYTGPTYCNIIKNCTLNNIKIENNCTDGIITNNIIWAANIEDGAINVGASSWQITDNEIVGGKRGGIYIPSGRISGLVISGNYFDGSYYDVDTQNGINASAQDSESFIINSVISNNNFWHQKGCGIYGRFTNTTISGNVFNDCDFYNNSVADIQFGMYSVGNTICGNTFIRNQYVDTSGVHHNRIDEDTPSFTRPSIIIIPVNGQDQVNAVVGNVCGSPEFYNKAKYKNDGYTYVDAVTSIGNSEIFSNNGNFGPKELTPANAGNGYLYYDWHKDKPEWKKDNIWADALGQTATIYKGTTSKRPTASSLDSTLDIGKCYFDTDLGKPIYIKQISNNTVTWVDATGTPV